MSFRWAWNNQAYEAGCDICVKIKCTKDERIEMSVSDILMIPT